jgi:hypothetical protein
MQGDTVLQTCTRTGHITSAGRGLRAPILNLPSFLETLQVNDGFHYLSLPYNRLFA